MSDNMVQQGNQAGRDVRHNEALLTGARVGLIAYGIVHLLIAWIALQVAWFSSGGSASSGGALRALASKPLGTTILWVSAIGLFLLALWQTTVAIWGYRTEDDTKKRTWKRLASGGRVVVYVVVGISAAKVAMGGGGSSGSDSKEEGYTAKLMSAPAGRWLVAAVGIAILVVGARQIRRGITKKFEHDLQPEATSGSTGWGVERVGQIGYVSKGTAVGIVGALFVWAAIDYDSKKAGGLDDALRTLRSAPFGQVLLTAVAIGLAAFGVYCFAWARYVKVR